MLASGHRHERIAEEIRHEISAMLCGELKDPRLATLVTVTEVRVSPDLKHARIYVSVLGTDAEQAAAFRALASATGFIRRELSTRLRLRRSPDLRFVHDRAAQYGQHLEELLRQVRKSSES
jgi:ribosome-binding factor A